MDRYVAVVPAVRVGTRATAAGNLRGCPVDVDPAHGRRGSGVARVVDAGAAVREGLTRTFAAHGRTRHRVGRDTGLNRALIRAAEGDRHVAVVPAVSVRLRAPAAADLRRRLVDIDASHRCWRSGISGLVDTDAAVRD